MNEIKDKPRAWEVVHNEPWERVRRYPIWGGWLYQVEVDIRYEGRPGAGGDVQTNTQTSGWHTPVFVPDAGDGWRRAYHIDKPQPTFPTVKKGL